MNSNGWVKWVVLVIVAAVIWFKVLPNIRHGEASAVGKSGASKSAALGPDCVGLAAEASEAWGSGIGRFVNPPIDASAWSSFHSSVSDKISRAESACGCSSPSCTKAHDAMSKLRRLVDDMDSAARNNSAPPNDAPQRQEEIDNLIDAARNGG